MTNLSSQFLSLANIHRIFRQCLTGVAVKIPFLSQFNIKYDVSIPLNIYLILGNF